MFGAGSRAPVTYPVSVTNASVHVLQNVHARVLAGRKLRDHTHTVAPCYAVTPEIAGKLVNLMPPFVLAIKGTRRRDNNSRSMFPVGGWYRRSASVVRVGTWNYVYLAVQLLRPPPGRASGYEIARSSSLPLYRRGISILYICMSLKRNSPSSLTDGGK